MYIVVDSRIISEINRFSKNYFNKVFVVLILKYCNKLHINNNINYFNNQYNNLKNIIDTYLNLLIQYYKS